MTTTLGTADSNNSSINLVLGMWTDFGTLTSVRPFQVANWSNMEHRTLCTTKMITNGVYVTCGVLVNRIVLKLK